MYLLLAHQVLRWKGHDNPYPSPPPGWAYQQLRERDFHNQLANHVPSAGLLGMPADVSLKADNPAMSQGLTYQLLQKEVTSRSLSQQCSCCCPINSRDRSDLPAVTSQPPSQPCASCWPLRSWSTAGLTTAFPPISSLWPMSSSDTGHLALLLQHQATLLGPLNPCPVQGASQSKLG